MSSKADLKLDWCSYQAAKYAVEKWHYSQVLPVGKTCKIGAWESSRFVGAIIFAYGANNNIGKPYNLSQIECAELVRVAIDSHRSPISRMLAVSIRMLRAANPGLRLVVSYADTREGHHGGIYQSAGWLFVGTSPGATEYLLRGRWVHSMQVQTSIRQGRVQTRTGMQTRKAGAKHKYLMPLDNEMRERIKPLAKLYPKRAASIDSDAVTNQVAEGGARPTAALQ